MIERERRLAAALLADRKRNVPERTDIGACFMCGRGMICCGSRFCSDRCRTYYDSGPPGHAQDWLRLKIDYYGITGWKVIAGPPGIEIGSDYYKTLHDAFEHGKARKGMRGRRQVEAMTLQSAATGARKVEKNKIANYTVKANGHGYWQPSAASRSLGFTSVDCGFDGDAARTKARALNEAASAARNRSIAAQNINREAA